MEIERSVVSMAKSVALADEPSERSQTDPSSNPFRARLTAFFWAHDPRQVDRVDQLLEEHAGKEEEFIQRIHREHGVRDFSGEIAVDDIYEHQRYSYLTFSWGSSFPGHLLPTDRRQWSGLHGTPSSQTRAKVEPQLPVHWQWSGEWEVDKETTNCDGDGWIYAFDFTNFNVMVKRSGGRKQPKATDYVRRRRWIRRRQRIPIAESQSSEAAASENETNDNDEETEMGMDLNIPDCLDVDDDEGEDPGDDDDDGDYAEDDDFELMPGSSSTQQAHGHEAAASGQDTTKPATVNPTTTSTTTATLQHFTTALEKPAIDAAWNMAVKNLETVYTQAKSQKTLHKKRWAVKKEKLEQQIHLLEKTIASMQSFVYDEQLKRRQSGSNLHASTTRSSPVSPDTKSGATASRVSANDTSGINLAAKLKCAQSKLDALKRLFWHPREKNYTLRLSIDGIFYGLRDFHVESFTSAFAVHVSHQSNGAQGITPTCKLTMKGHVVCCGKHVKVVGEKGTIVPKSLWDLMHLDSDFELAVYMIYVDELEKERNPWLADKPTGKWEFLFAPESTRVELTNFNRRTKGGLDLPEPVVRKLMADVLSGLVRDIALGYLPPELAMAFDAPPAKFDLEGDVAITGVPIDAVMEREIELTSGKPATPAAATPSPPSEPLSPSSASAFAAVAAAASATVNLLIHSDVDEAMRRIAALLQLSPGQLNLLVALRQCGLYPSPYSFRSVASLCDYYTAFFATSDAATDQQLRTTWTQLLELVYLRKLKQATAKPYELFDMGRFWTRVGELTRKPASVQLSVSRVNCTLNARSVVDALAQVFERLVLGIDYSKPRADAGERLLYGFRFGRKPTVSTVAALVAHAQSAQLLDPTIHVQLDAAFRSRLKVFSHFCRALKGIIDLAKRNLDRLSLEVAGHVQGTGKDCAVFGSFKDLEFVGPVSLSLLVPPLFLGLYRLQTVALSNDRVGLQVDLLLPPKTSKKKVPKTSSNRVLLKAMLTDFSMDVLLDVDALLSRHHARSLSSASQMTAPWSPSASFRHQVEREKTHDKHAALSVSLHSTTAASDAHDEHVVRVPSPRATASPPPYGKVSVASSDLTKLHVAAKTGAFSTRLLLLLQWLVHRVRPLVVASFPEHLVLFDRLHACVVQWLCGQQLHVDFDLLVKSFLHEVKGEQLLFFTVTGVPSHPTPVAVRDQWNLLDVVLQGDELVNLWIDDKYPPYASPLYF